MANCLVYGKRRQGKSTLSLAVAIDAHSTVVIFDPNDQYPNVQRIDLHKVDEWMESIPDNDGRLHVARVGPFNTDEVETAFTILSDQLWQWRDFSLIVDESSMLQNVHGVHASLDRWNRRSPADVLVIQNTHQIVNTHGSSRYHADHVFFFFAVLPRELKTIAENFDPPDMAEKIPQLPRHHVLHQWRESGGIGRYSIWDRPDEWFIDLGNDNR